jgi:aspartate-semialdehyde dehydrogenase
MGYRVVVAGATGNVGREMLNILAERQFPVNEIAVLASRRSLGTEVSFGDKTLKTQDLDTFDFTGWDIALFAIGSDATKKYAPVSAKAGCVVIDNSSLYRYDPDVPLIVPECNADAIHGYSKKNIIANPNCSTAQMVVALKPLHDRARIKRVVVSTYQSVSGAGKEGMDELWDQTKAVYNPVTEVPPAKFQKQIAFNVIPQIDVFMEDGSTKEEWKMMVETKKIIDPSIKVTATCVRVPVFVGRPASWSSISVNRAAMYRLSNVLVIMRLSSAASVKTQQSKTALTSGVCPTTCARAQPSTQCKSLRCWAGKC